MKSTDEKIRITAEKVFNNNIDSYVKVCQQRIIEKWLMDEVVQELHSSVSKSVEEIDILKKANMSKSDKIKKCQETLKEMSTKMESKYSQQLSVNQIKKKVETLFSDLVKKQSVSNKINQNSLVNQDDSTNGYSESFQDKV